MTTPPTSPRNTSAPRAKTSAQPTPALPATAGHFHFGRFELQPRERLLLCDGQPVALRRRSFDLLLALTEEPGRLVTRQQLLDRVWPGLVVEENNLSVQINALRKVLGNPFITTVPGLGYRFVAPPATARAADVSAPAPRLDSAAQRSNLPEVLVPLIGRDAELNALARLVDLHPLVTVLGAAGMGKTRLAQALLHQRRGQGVHGVCFVELAALPPGAAVLGTVAAAVGLPQPSGGSALADLVAALQPLDLLLALDNAEHVLEAVATLAAALAAGAPGVRLVVTSQAPLRLAEERLFRLGALALPEASTLAALGAQNAQRYGAVALFVARAQALDHRFRLDDSDVAPVVELCRRLDGAPLAIELAVARVRQFGVATLLASLDSRLALLTSGRRDRPVRHQTLRAALEWSHGLLAPAEQAVFRRLSVFVGSASLAQAVQVLADEAPGGLDEWAVLDALGALVDRSLVEVLPGTPEGTDPAPRYRHLDTPLALAREQLLACGEGAEWQRRHALALCAQYLRAREDLYSGRQRFDDWKDRLDPDADNALAAAHWAVANDQTTALALIPVLSRQLFGRRYADCRRLWEAIEPWLDAAPAGPTTAQAAWLARAACECSVFWTNHRLAHSRMRAEQALAWVDAEADPATHTLALSQLAWACGNSGDAAGLLAASQAMRPLPGASPFLQAMSSQHVWLAAYLAGDVEGALLALGRLVAQVSAAGCPDIAHRGNMASLLLKAGRLDESIAIGQDLRARSAGQRNPGSLAYILNNLVQAHLARDDTASAREALTAFWPLAERFDLRPLWAAGAALLAALEQRPLAALRLVGWLDAAATAGTPRDKAVDRAEQLALAALTQRPADPWVPAAQARAEGATWPLGGLQSLGLDSTDR